MEVEVRLFASFRVGRFKYKRLTFNDEAKIIDILDSLKIKKEELGLVLVNGIYSDTDAFVKDNDVLAIFPPVAGG
ncbi:MAG: MoaD/ThiS family protein [Tissierellia bacterium]|jgi:sulfur carrier protein|nr:MoaD/ThiS family protein [Tissierellia bacterium]MDD3227064.1 MoaD/ThiS family protein [Tissierellia bacterium]MDD3751138.1 MoaD/ThiS family protein [Tissierellia bacterium]MDD4046780.1 MoaD/ThiS family protein [Tissierellia bacterium]MDD4678592.1 MoaD/ThiS family protein [Tissierellia bacterium]